MLSPLIPCHKTILNSRSGTASSFARLNLSERLCHSLMATFLRFRSTEIGFARNPAWLGVFEKHLHIGVAAASYCDMGGNPKMSSMVLITEVVEYIV